MSCNFDFTGKLVLVTGGGSGIGLTIAEKYAKTGANIVINDMKQENIDKAIEQIKCSLKKQSQHVSGICADLSTAEGCQKVIEGIDKIGHLDILINNVGFFKFNTFEETSDDEWMKFINVNFMSNVRLCRAFLPKMLAKDEKTGKSKGGNIVCVASEQGVRGMKKMIPYSVTKAAQICLARGLAELCQGVPNVRVNSLLPGPTWTEGMENHMQDMAEKKGTDLNQARKDYFNKVEPKSIYDDFLNKGEIADVCLFLTADAASAVRGASQRAEGGIIKHI